MQMLHQQKAAGQMQRDPSDMDANRVRPASPASADNAPSPSKRPRLDGTAPFNPNQGVMMPNGRPGQGMPGQQQVGNGPGPARALPWIGINPTPLNPDQLQAFSSAAPHAQAKTLATYSTNMSQHHGNQMPNRPVANPAGPQGQGSPMVPPGPDGNSLTQYYNPGDMGPGNMRPGAANGQATGGSNHALQDYQMQLMLLEQQNKKRLMMARQEQDMSTNNMPRPDGSSGGPGNVGGPGAGPPGPNAQGFQQGTSPPGGRNGASPNPSEQMKRAANQQMNNAGNMGSPLPDGTAQSRSSPNSMNYMGAANMDPNAGGQPFFKGVEGMNMNMAAQMNGAMRPPSSHPPFNGQMNQQQMMAAQRQAQQQQQQQQQPGGAQGAPGMPGQWPQGGPNGQMAGQPPQPQQVQGNPTQAQRSMPPPSAPATAATTAAANATNARNTTASPQVSNAAPPTPQQAAKAAPKKKETKASKTKVSWHVSPRQKKKKAMISSGIGGSHDSPFHKAAAAQKKTNPTMGNAGTTGAPEAEGQQEAPTPATPITPVNPGNFAKNQNVNAGAQVVPNGQAPAPAPPPPQPQAAPVAAPQSHTDPGQSNFLDPGNMVRTALFLYLSLPCRVISADVRRRTSISTLPTPCSRTMC